MLILARKPGESFMIADDIEVHVVKIGPHRVRLAIDAPQSIRVLRKEIYSAATSLGVEAGRRCNRFECDGKIKTDGEAAAYCPTCGWDQRRDG
jgi:carbon storage regulator